MNHAALSYPICQPFHPLYAKLSLFPYTFFLILKGSIPFFTNQINFCGTGLMYMALQAKLLSQFFKVIQYSYETFQTVAPILHSVICSR